LAPEIISGKGYGKEVDYWSIGVILYIMLCGFPPFYDDDNQILFKMIQEGQVEFPSPYWDDISMSAKELIRLLLVKDPSKRLNAE
jgi:calcium/calmodulin-dependent protein kinase I